MERAEDVEKQVMEAYNIMADMEEEKKEIMKDYGAEAANQFLSKPRLISWFLGAVGFVSVINRDPFVPDSQHFAVDEAKDGMSLKLGGIVENVSTFLALNYNTKLFQILVGIGALLVIVGMVCNPKERTGLWRETTAQHGLSNVQWLACSAFLCLLTMEPLCLRGKLALNSEGHERYCNDGMHGLWTQCLFMFPFVGLFWGCYLVPSDDQLDKESEEHFSIQECGLISVEDAEKAVYKDLAFLNIGEWTAENLKELEDDDEKKIENWRNFAAKDKLFEEEAWKIEVHKKEGMGEMAYHSTRGYHPDYVKVVRKSWDNWYKALREEVRGFEQEGVNPEEAVQGMKKKAYAQKMLTKRRTRFLVWVELLQLSVAFYWLNFVNSIVSKAPAPMFMQMWSMSLEVFAIWTLLLSAFLRTNLDVIRIQFPKDLKTAISPWYGYQMLFGVGQEQSGGQEKNYKFELKVASSWFLLWYYLPYGMFLLKIHFAFLVHKD